MPNHTFTQGPEFIDVESTSTSEIIYLFAKENNYIIPKVAAEAMYLGIFTDSARFQYATYYTRMFDILKDLILLGVEPVKLTSILNVSSEQSLKIKRFVYRNVKKVKPGILYVYATKKDRERMHIKTVSVVANLEIASSLSTGFSFSFNPFCLVPMFVLSLFIGLTSSFVMSKRINKINPLEALKA